MANTGIPTVNRGQWVDQQEARLAVELPGWKSHAIRTHNGLTLWNAGPEGCSAAIITNQATPDELIKAVRKYEERLADHIADMRQRVEAIPDTGIGRDEKRSLMEVITALDALAAHKGASAVKKTKEESK